MSKEDKCKNIINKYILPFVACSSAVVFPLSLLITKSIDGASYVAMNAILIFGFGVYKFHPRIAEFSVAGNSIKLKETLNEAEKLTRELKELRNVSMFQFFSSMYVTSGNNLTVMKRFYDFLIIYNVISMSESLVNEFKTEVISSLTCLKYSMEIYIRPHFDSDSNKTFDEKVKDVFVKLSSKPTLLEGEKIAKDFAVNIMLIEDIYNDVYKDAPRQVKIPDFLGAYKVFNIRG